MQTMKVFSRYRLPLLFAVLILCFIFLWPFLKDFQFLYFDYHQYWIAGNETLAGENPYLSDDPFIYPPWVIPLGMPFGALPFNLSRWLWYFLEMGLMVFTCYQFWEMYKGPVKLRWMAFLAGITFSSTLFTLVLGQLSPFILTGILIFLRHIQLPNRKAVNLAWLGFATYLIALKPQIFYLFWIILILWSIKNQDWKPLLASFTAITLASLIPMIFVPGLIPKYILSFTSSPPDQWGTPTLGYWLRLVFGEHLFFLQFLPPLAGIVWATYFWMRGTENWNWVEKIPLLVFGSLITGPYGWTHDYFILLPAILQSFIVFSSVHKLHKTLLVIALWVSFNTAIVVLHFQISDYWFYWQLPFLLLFYLSTTRSFSTSSPVPEFIPTSKAEL